MKRGAKLVPIDKTQPIGDLVDMALKIADEQFQLEQQIKEAILADDDARLKVLAKQLVGLQ